MNILILGNYPPPYGGVPHHIKLLSDYLGNNGNNVIVLAGGNGVKKKIGNVRIIKNNIYKKIIFIIFSLRNPLFKEVLFNNRISFSNIKYFLRLNLFYNIANSVIKNENIDIILSYNLFYYSPIAYELNKKYQIPYIVNVFGEIYRLDVMKKNKNFYLNILNNSKYNISCSLHCAKSINILEKSSKIQYKSILYGIDLNIFNSNNLNLETKNKIGFFGRIDTEMGLDIFEQIIENLSDFNTTFIIAGQKGNYFKKIEDFKLKSQFKIETYYNVSTQKLANLYKECSLVIVPSRGLRTCSSLATMEAMSCGCVVLGHNIGGIPELIVSETGFLIDFEDVDMFVNNIKNIKSNYKELCEKRSNSIEYAKNNFSQELMCKNFYNLIID